MMPPRQPANIPREALLAKLKEGLRGHELAKVFGVTDVTVYKYIRRYNLSHMLDSRRGVKVELDRAALEAGLLRGDTLVQMAAQLGASHQTVRARISDYGLDHLVKAGLPAKRSKAGAVRHPAGAPCAAAPVPVSDAPSCAAAPGPRMAAAPKPAAPIAAPFWTPERDALLARCTGYADLAEAAEVLGVSLSRVQARWHQLRVCA